jgi:hypothetical protein
MARLGQENQRPNENGKAHFGDKDVEFLKKTSREAVEETANMPILYFQLDPENSKRNFYGEMTVKRFKNVNGIQIRGSYRLKQNEMSKQHGIPKKTMSLSVTVYTEQLEELGIEPLIGEYFYVGERYYQIYDKTINDVGAGSLLMRERVACTFAAFEVENETIQKIIINDQGQSGEVI